jgi:rhomboid protease GluP
MFGRQTTGSVVCVSCGYLVGVRDDKCYHCGRRNPGLWGFAPALRSLGHDLGFVPFVTGMCIVLYVLMLLFSGGEIMGNPERPSVSGFLSPNLQSLLMFGASGSYVVFELGWWWTVLSAGWLHAGLIHILFNVVWIRQLAPAVGEMYGPGRMVIIYVAGSVLGFALTSLVAEYFSFVPFLSGARLSVGASAPIFGLLGALVYYGRRSGSSMVSSQAWSMALFMAMFGFIFPGIDNVAHAGGFGGGYLAARLLDPLKPERVNHMLAAVICLALSMLAIIASFIRFLTIDLR